MNDENTPKERLRENLDQCLYDISTAAKRSGRPSSSVVLLPVTKYVDAAVIRMLYDLGLRAFGESRVQRLTQLHRELDDLADLQWHMIGHLQRNKARRACECCTCIHSLDSLRLAKELVAQSTTHNRSLPKLYVEVNVAGESQKSGLAESELDEVLQFLSQVEPRASGSESTIAGLMSSVRPVGLPWRPLKFLLDDEAQTSRSCSRSGFIARHMEQPAARHSKPAS